MSANDDDTVGASVRAFVLTASSDAVDAASDALWGLGVRAIEERPTTGSVELWTAVGDEPEAIARAVEHIGGRWPHRIEEVSTGWSLAWREHARAVGVDERLTIVPAWRHDVGAEAAGDALVVRIEPAGAFGLGDHPTTRASAVALLDLLEPGGDGLDVLDVGCGTGVLAITAAMCQDRSVRAIDVAAAAVEATIDNATRNGVGGRIEVDATPLESIEDGFDVVVANILAPTLVALADDLRRVTRPDGHLVISGVLEGSHDHVLAALAPMEAVHTVVVDGWASVTLRH